MLSTTAVAAKAQQLPAVQAVRAVGLAKSDGREGIQINPFIQVVG
jgi:hypothetical protein